MNKIVDLAHNYTLLKVIPHEYLEKCIENNSLRIKSYNKGEVIHFDGDHCTHIELILEGCAIIERIDVSGDLLTITELFSDDLLGSNLVFSKRQIYPMTISAKTQVSLLMIQKELLFELCSSNIEFLQLFLEYVSELTFLLGDKIKRYVNRSIRESLVGFLKREYFLQQSTKILLPYSKKALADSFGVQRTSLSRELQKMKRERLIEFDVTSITVLDLQLLR